MKNRSIPQQKLSPSETHNAYDNYAFSLAYLCVFPELGNLFDF